MWHCDKLRLRPQGHGSKLSLSSVLSTPLGSKRSIRPSAQLSPAWMRASDKTDQDFKLGILNEDKRSNINLEQQSGSNPEAGIWLASFFYFFFNLQVMDKRDNYYFNKTLLSYSCVVLFCNPTAWIYQINTLIISQVLKKSQENFAVRL